MYNAKSDTQRNNLLQLLQDYQTDDPWQLACRQRMMLFIQEYEMCFSRECRPGHITASAWLLDYSQQKVLLTLHKKLGLWLQLGGHVDGSAMIVEQACREAREESGILAIQPIYTHIFDIDIHEIPANTKETAHLHFDIRFLLRVTQEHVSYRLSEESIALQWFSHNELNSLKLDSSVCRLQRKWQVYLSTTDMAME
ncbi:MAG: NUDIX hydrolase [Gammaproteobacteria bacterium]